MGRGGGDRRSGAPSAEQRKGQQQRSAREGQPAEGRMKDGDGGQPDGNPGQIQKCAEDRCAKKTANGIGRLRPRAAAFDRVLENRAVEACLQCAPDAGQDPSPCDVEQCNGQIHGRDEGHERDECFFRPAGQNAVVDEQHEEWPGQDQQVQDGAEQDGPEEETAHPVKEPHAVMGEGVTSLHTLPRQLQGKG
jgi:hypothetical protein